MEGNHRNFDRLFTGAITIFSLMLGTVGILSYLQFGYSTQQIITQNLPKGHIKMTVQIISVVALVFLYPLNIYPAIETLEATVLTPSKY